MPKIPEPVVKLTKQQWEGLIKRLMKREGAAFQKIPERIDDISQLLPRARNLITRREPPVEQTYGRLLESRSVEELKQAVAEGTTKQRLRGQMLPIEDAQAAYLNQPGKFLPVRPSSPGKILKVGIEEGAPSEIYPGLGFEKAKFKSVLPQSIERSVSTERAATPLASTIPQTDQLKSAWEGDIIWTRIIGGLRSIPGKLWKSLFEQSRSRRGHANAREYFIAQYSRWKTSPETFARNQPRESNFMKSFYPQIKDVIEEGVVPSTRGVAPSAYLKKEEIMDLLSGTKGITGKAPKGGQ